MKVLITAASTAWAYKLEKILPPANIVLADSVDLPEFMVKGKHFIKIPSGDAFSFAHQLLTLCLDEGIEKVYALRRSEIEALSPARQLFDEYNIKVMVPQPQHLPALYSDSKIGTLEVREEELKLPGRGVFLIADNGNIQILTVD